MKKHTIIIACVTAFVLSVAAAVLYPTKKKEPIDEYITRQESQSRWIRMLNQENSQLHDAVLAAMLASKASGKEVFIQIEQYPLSRFKYKLSYERGGAENLLSYNHVGGYFSFDHYSEKIGPTLTAAENMIVIDRKINRYYSELGIK